MTEQRPADGSKYTSHACEDTLLAQAEIEACRRLIKRTLGTPLSSGDILLDVGCGSSGDGLEIAGKARYVGLDRDQECVPFELQSSRAAYHPVDIRETGSWAGEKASVVLSKRMLCQIPQEEHAEVIRLMWRMVRPGGALVLCEPWARDRARLSAARVSWGLSPLPEPASGGRCPELNVATGAVGTWHWRAEPVAPEYVVWTRLLSEVVTGRLPGYQEEWPRVPPFVLSPEYRKLAFYAAVSWLKPQ